MEHCRPLAGKAFFVSLPDPPKKHLFVVLNDPSPGLPSVSVFLSSQVTKTTPGVKVPPQQAITLATETHEPYVTDKESIFVYSRLLFMDSLRLDEIFNVESYKGLVRQDLMKKLRVRIGEASYYCLEPQKKILSKLLDEWRAQGLI